MFARRSTDENRARGKPGKTGSGCIRGDIRFCKASGQQELLGMVTAEEPGIHLLSATGKKPGESIFPFSVIPATFNLIYPPTRVIKGDRSLQRHIVIGLQSKS